MRIHHSYILFSLLLLSACSYKVQKEGEVTSLAAITGPISFSRVQSEVLTKCTRCHRWAERFEGVHAKLGEISARILAKDPGFKMPKPGSPDLTANERALLLEWIRRGGPEVAEEVVEQPQQRSQPPSQAPTKPGQVLLTFALVKAKVLDAKCLRCHKKDFDSFADARPLIREMDYRLKATGTKDQMPPAGKAQLTAEEKQLLLDWIQAGAREN